MNNTNSILTSNSGELTSGINNLEVIGSVSDSIVNILDEDGIVALKQNQDRFNYLLSQLRNEINLISELNGFNYEGIDYAHKLASSKCKTKESIKLLLHDNPQLNSIYAELLHLLNEVQDSSFIENIIFKEYFEDLVYEIILLDNEQIISKDDNELFDSEFDFPDLIKKLNQIESFIAQTSQKPFLVLEFIMLWTFPINKLQPLFDSLGHLKYLNISGNDFKWLNVINIKPLFSKLDLKFIELKKVKYSHLSSEYINTLFSCFKHLKAISLSQSDIGKLDKNQLLSIFPYLNDLKYINIGFTDLSWLNEEELGIIFSNLPNVININLDCCQLWDLNDKCLEIIFSNLKNLKVLHMHISNYSNQQIELIMKIHPNLIIEN